MVFNPLSTGDVDSRMVIRHWKDPSGQYITLLS